jgi:hypothetical protein
MYTPSDDIWGIGNIDFILSKPKIRRPAIPIIHSSRSVLHVLRTHSKVLARISVGRPWGSDKSITLTFEAKCLYSHKRDACVHLFNQTEDGPRESNVVLV